MKLPVLLTSASLCALSFGAFAQQTPQQALTEEFIEEKIRTPELRERVEEIKEQHDAGLPYTLMSKEEIESITSRYQNPELRSEETFTGGAEPHIAMNPANHDHIVVTYMGSAGDFDYPIYYTTDGGTTWTQSSFSTAAELQNQYPSSGVLGGGDPILAFDEDGTVYLTWIYAHGGFATGINAGMFYAYSSDGGANFTVPDTTHHVVYSGNLLNNDILDRQWMDVDNSGGTYDGNLYMSGVYFGGPLGPAGELCLIKTPADSGFTSVVSAIPVTANESTQFGNVKVDGNGVVHMSAMRFAGSSGAGNIVYTQSTDGGMTWSTAVDIAPATTALPNGGNHLVHDRDNSAVSLAVDGSNVYIAWSDMANNDVRSFYAYSNDGGVTWSNAIEYGVDVLDNTYYHLMPNVAAEGGTMSIAWYAVDRTSLESWYHIVQSADAGVTLGPAGVVSPASTDFSAAGQQDFYGDYNSSVRSGCETFAAYSDGRTGAPVLYVAKFNTCNVMANITEFSPLNGGLSVSDLYPNPAINEANLTFELEQKTAITVEVFGTNGQLVQALNAQQFAAGQHTLQLDVSELATGTYMVKVNTAEGVFATRTLVK